MYSSPVMQRTRPKIAVIVMAAAFNVYLAKGHLEWLPDWIPICVWLVAGACWVWTTDSVKQTVRSFTHRRYTIIDPSTNKPVAMRRVYKQALVATLAISAASILCGIIGWRTLQHYRPPFSIALESPSSYSTAKTKEDGTQVFWVSYNARDCRAISPVDSGIYVRLTNLQREKVTLTDYNVDMYTSANKWVKVLRIPTNGASVFIATKATLRQASVVSGTTQYLDRVLQNHVLGPGETVRGWLFLEYPDRKTVFTNRFRMTLTDAANDSFTGILQEPTVNTAHFGSIDVAGGARDISNLCQKYFHELQ